MSSVAAMEPVRIGLVGYGFGGRWFHAPLLRSAPECSFVGVVTSSPARRKLVSEDDRGLPTFESLEALAAAGAEAVAISTPADTHSALTDRALELGLASSATSRSPSTPPRRCARWSSPSDWGCRCRRTRTGAGTPTS